MKSLNLYIPATKTTPEIHFSPGTLHIVGESFPEDGVDFYTPVMQWIEAYEHSAYVRDKKNKTVFTSNVDYFNTTSRGYILEIIRRMNDLYKKGHKVSLTWYYDQTSSSVDLDDVDFKSLIDDFKIPTQYIPK